MCITFFKQIRAADMEVNCPLKVLARRPLMVVHSNCWRRRVLCARCHVLRFAAGVPDATRFCPRWNAFSARAKGVVLRRKKWFCVATANAWPPPFYTERDGVVCGPCGAATLEGRRPSISDCPCGRRRRSGGRRGDVAEIAFVQCRKAVERTHSLLSFLDRENVSVNC